MTGDRFDEIERGVRYRPNGWIATHINGEVLHFSEADGWSVEVVTEERVEPNNNNNRYRKHDIPKG